MTHPQDPEQQARDEWMIAFGFRKVLGGQAFISGILTIPAPTATFFYQAFHAQVAEARLDELCRLIGKQENASEGSLINWGYVVPVPEINARIAQLNPQKPKDPYNDETITLA